MSPLHAIFQFELHVVAQIVEPELVIRSIGNIRSISRASFLVVQVVDDHAHRQPQKLVDLAHPLRIALGQVVVHRHHVNPVPRQSIQVASQRRHQRLALAGFHFGNLARVQNHAADKLHIEMPHLHRAPARLAHHGKSLRQNLVQRGLLSRLQLILVRNPFEPRRNSGPELDRPRPQLFIRKLLRRRLQSVDLSHHRPKPLENAVIRSTENLRKNRIEKHRNLRLPV